MTDSTRYVTAPPMQIAPVTLEGKIVRLVPMERHYAEELFACANFPDIWTWTGTRPITSLAKMHDYMDIAFAEQAAGHALPFVTLNRDTGAVIGSTRFANIHTSDRRVEVGWSWLRPDLRRTGANSEAKCLMFQHAFDTWGALRIEIKTDVLNARSRAAIERLGGTYEGTFRQHMVVKEGRVRNTAYYSIIDTDWRDPNHRAHQRALAHGITPRTDPVV